jgi:hypothetical protein
MVVSVDVAQRMVAIAVAALVRLIWYPIYSLLPGWMVKKV